MPKSLPKSTLIVDSTGFLALDHMPRSLVIIGGGVLGCEFATMASELGCKVTIVEAQSTILPQIDDDLRNELVKSFTELGVDIKVGAPVTDVESDSDGVYGTVGEGEIFADAMLVAAGRVPNTDGIGLDYTGVDFNSTGIRIDEHCRTSVPTIFAVGDVTRYSSQLAGDAMEQGRIAADAICGQLTPQCRLTPKCIFTHPEIATAGTTEKCATESGISIRTEKSFFKYNGMAAANDTSLGFVKRIYDEDRGTLIGVGIVGEHASELISIAAAQLPEQYAPPHPSLSESIFTSFWS